MAVGTRRTTRIADRRLKVAEMYLRGQPQSAIANVVGVKQAAISKDLQYLRREWLKSSVELIDQRKAIELAKIDKLEMEYWDAWERSRLPAETEITEQVGAKGRRKSTDPDEEQTIVPLRLRKYKRVEGQSGNPAFLAGVQWCIEKRCAIFGLNAPTQNMNVDLTRMTDMQLQQLAQGESLINVALMNINSDNINPQNP